MNVEDLTDEQITIRLAEMMGLTYKTKLPNGSRCCPFYEKDGKLWKSTPYFRPLEDANATLLVIEAMREKGWTFSADSDLSRTAEAWTILFNTPGPMAIAEADTFQRAVCLAAVKAIQEAE